MNSANCTLSEIKTPEQFATEWFPDESGKRISLERDVAAYTTAIRAHDREQHRQEVVAEIAMEFGKSVSPNAPLWLEVTMRAPSLQPVPAPTHPKALEVADQLLDSAMSLTPAYRDQLAKLIEGAVKEWN